MHPGRLRHALCRAPRATGRAVLGGVLAGTLLAGCAAGGDEGAATAPPDAAVPSPTSTADSGETLPAPSLPAQSQDPDMTQSADPTQPPPGEDGDGGDALTEQDSGARFTLAVGEERPLQLGSAWSWAEPVVDGAAVTLTPVDFLVDPGYVEWLVTGAAAGTATLQVVGEPVCGDTTVCPPTTVTLEVEVTD